MLIQRRLIDYLWVLIELVAFNGILRLNMNAWSLVLHRRWQLKRGTRDIKATLFLKSVGHGYPKRGYPSSYPFLLRLSMA